MLIGLIVFFGLSLLILLHEAGHFFAAKYFGLSVEEFGFGYPPRITAWKRGETEYSLNWLPFGGFVRIAGENDRIQGAEHLAQIPEDKKQHFFFGQKAWKRSVVILAGVAVNFLLGWFLLSALFMVGTPKALIVTGVQSGSPAQIVGLEAGDVLLDYASAESFIQFINAHRGEVVQLKVLHHNEEKMIEATPRKEVGQNEGALGVMLGEAGIARESFFAALRDGLLQSGIIFWQTILSFGDLLKAIVVQRTIPEGVSGPVGIFSIAQETGKLGLVYLVQLLALISINLCVLNLMPFPAVDGGRFFLILVEKIKGSPISLKTEAWINGLGFIFLILLIGGITVRDILKLL